ncbi:uncharacterized protein PV06_03936 [Exophiala oligosperma]|uniref:Mediator of RNA polymerase II transcription subunit 7 n=2 Tax=Chaetothyriales TaxID=34395 RepID=A0A0D2DSX2_9EURO|nr:uncharacterized protein PV06_03936 [Exophiala oligosperma]KAJ9620067.1 Mediator of RNA polymerase II transcription subunit 7 [Knufia peltigerae]KIW45555.1 hypothetical protein PV06_03936 [Exophiala oligosperma]
MADQEQQQLPEAPFPAPPPFWRHFTTANEEKLKEIDSSEAGRSEKLRIPLAYLRPPPPPPESAEVYTTFGQSQVIDPSKPASLPRDQLLFDPDRPNLNHAVLLSKMTKSLMLNFLELTCDLSLDPTSYEEKIEDIRQLVLNIHVVINMYRPHQARESVKEMLESILEDGEREIEESDKLKQRAEEFLAETGKTDTHAGSAMIVDTDGETSKIGRGSAKMDEQRRLWDMIHELTD